MPPRQAPTHAREGNKRGAPASEAQRDEAAASESRRESRPGRKEKLRKEGRLGRRLSKMQMETQQGPGSQAQG